VNTEPECILVSVQPLLVGYSFLQEIENCTAESPGLLHMHGMGRPFYRKEYGSRNRPCQRRACLRREQQIFITGDDQALCTDPRLSLAVIVRCHCIYLAGEGLSTLRIGIFKGKSQGVVNRYRVVEKPHGEYPIEDVSKP
jgi:hypothetical protein